MSLSPDTSNWRTDFAEYRRLVNQGLVEAIADKEKIAFLAGMHPDHDIVKSLKASVVLFWGEFAGWENKKRKKIKNLNMEMTLINSVAAGRNLVRKNSYQEPARQVQQRSEPVAIDQGEQRKNYHYTQLIARISRAIMKFSDKTEKLKKFNAELQAAVMENSTYEYVDAVYKKMMAEEPWAFETAPGNLFCDKPKTVTFLPDAEERRKRFVAQYGKR